MNGLSDTAIGIAGGIGQQRAETQQKLDLDYIRNDLGELYDRLQDLTKQLESRADVITPDHRNDTVLEKDQPNAPNTIVDLLNAIRRQMNHLQRHLNRF